MRDDAAISIYSVFSLKGKIMQNEGITDEDRRKAKQCLECPFCKRARKKQKGLVFWFVKKVESGFCPPL